MNTQLFVSGQKKIEGLLIKDIFKVVILEEVLSKIQVFNSSWVYNIKNSYINKAYEKNYLIVYSYNDEKNNLMLIHLLKISWVNQVISFGLFAIIWVDDNNNIKFYLQDIT